MGKESNLVEESVLDSDQLYPIVTTLRSHPKI